MVEEIFSIVRSINQQEGVSILLVEQNAKAALSVADYGYILENGHIMLDGTAEDLLNNPDVQEFYLGLSKGQEGRSYRNVKHYRRRKRWLG
jgi:branched-chain amino acid transport system ATP-binding protein